MIKIAFLTTFLAITGCASQPPLDPDRWLNDYDYQESLQGYLERNFAESITVGRVPYVYIYGDWCLPCRRLRREAMTDKDFAVIFKDTQIILLDHDRLKRVKGSPSYGGVPIIAPVTENGELDKVVVYGVPWSRSLPRDIKYQMCVYFDLRRVTTSKLDRNCGQYKS